MHTDSGTNIVSPPIIQTSKELGPVAAAVAVHCNVHPAVTKNSVVCRRPIAGGGRAGVDVDLPSAAHSLLTDSVFSGKAIPNMERQCTRRKQGSVQNWSWHGSGGAVIHRAHMGRLRSGGSVTRKCASAMTSSFTHLPNYFFSLFAPIAALILFPILLGFDVESMSRYKAASVAPAQLRAAQLGR